MSRSRRIICYAVNGSGLGHVTRLLAVARWMRRYATFLDGTPPEIFFLTSTEATGLLAEAGFPAFKLPSKTVARQAGLDLAEYRRLARQFVWHVLGLFRPDLLVVDTFPSGSFDELFQLLDGPFRKAFIHREVKPEYGRRPVFQAALGLYDVVVAPHSTLTRDPALPAAPGGRGRAILPCGEVLQLEREEARSRAEVEAELGLEPTTRLIFLSAGGGGDPTGERTLLALVDALRGQPGLHLLVGAGPLYRGRRRGGPGVTWSSDPGLARTFGVLSAAISAGGYNTFHELLYFGVPALFFSQEKIADDQRRRIELAAARGACRWLADPLDPELVRRELAALLEPATRAAMTEACRSLLPENGAQRCARLLLGPLYGEEELARIGRLFTSRLVHGVEELGPATAAAVYGSVLPRLWPGALASGLRDHPQFERLLEGLSAAAAAEVNTALRCQPEQEGVPQWEAAVLGLLALANQLELDRDRLTGLVETALKKHPRAQEPGRAPLAWTIDLLEGLSRLLELARPAPTGSTGLLDELLQFYRVFPRLHDCGARDALELCRSLCQHQLAQGRPLTSLVGPLQGIKLAQRQVYREQLGSLLEPSGGLGTGAGSPGLPAGGGR